MVVRGACYSRQRTHGGWHCQWQRVRTLLDVDVMWIAVSPVSLCAVYMSSDPSESDGAYSRVL